MLVIPFVTKMCDEKSALKKESFERFACISRGCDVTFAIKTKKAMAQTELQLETPSADIVIERGRTAYDDIKAMAMRGELPDLSLDEINNEIRMAREER